MEIIKQETPINMNAQVKVFLTIYGREIYKKHFEDLKCLDYMPDPREELKMSMWELAHIFGSVLYMGNPKNPFVDNEIKMDFKLNEDKEIESIIN